MKYNEKYRKCEHLLPRDVVRYDMMSTGKQNHAEKGNNTDDLLYAVDNALFVSNCLYVAWELFSFLKKINILIII